MGHQPSQGEISGKTTQNLISLVFKISRLHKERKTEHWVTFLMQLFCFLDKILTHACNYVYLPPSPTHFTNQLFPRGIYKFSFPFHSPKLSVAKIFVADSEFCRQYFCLQTVRLSLHLSIISIFLGFI